MNILLIGAPNAGKGTVGEVLVDELNMVLVSTGALFREEMARGSELGKEAETYIKNGVLVPNELTFRILVDRIERDDCRKQGFILDGFPRSMEQVEFLEKYLSESETNIDKVIYIEVEEKTIYERVSGRRLCRDCGAVYNINSKPSAKGNRCEKCDGELYQRKDETPEIVARRIESFKNDTYPIINHFDNKGLVYRIDGNQSLDYTLEQVFKVLGKERGHNR
jgi:adenylate kinase